MNNQKPENIRSLLFISAAFNYSVHEMLWRKFHFKSCMLDNVKMLSRYSSVLLGFEGEFKICGTQRAICVSQKS